MVAARKEMFGFLQPASIVALERKGGSRVNWTEILKDTNGVSIPIADRILVGRFIGAAFIVTAISIATT